MPQGLSELVEKQIQVVYQVISDAITSTDGWTWIQDVKNEDGRLAIKCLHDHSDGPVQRQIECKMHRRG